MVRYGKSFAFIVAAMVVLLIAVPNLLSTSYVKQQISLQISQLIGRQVSITGSSSISLRPYLGVSYNDVTIIDDFDAKGKPLVSMDGIKARLSILSALWGNAKATELEFIRPQFNFRIDQNGHRNWDMDSGLMGAKLNSPGMIDQLALGTLKVIDGIVEINDERSRNTRQFTAVNGTLIWPKSSSAVQASFSSVWNGEVANVELSITDPLEFFRGNSSELSLRLQSNPADVAFSGSVTEVFKTAEGNLTLNSPSPKRLFEWVGLNIAAVEQLGEAGLSGPVKIDEKSVEFSEAELSIGEHSGKGRMQISLSEQSILSVSGTLAFDSIELPALSLDAVEASSQESSFDAAAFDGLALDIRLSAGTATIAPIVMTDLAASIIVRENEASFDIGQASAMNGTLAGSLSLKTEEQNIALAADVSLSQIALEELTGISREDGVSLEGIGTLTAKFKSSANNRNGLISKLNGGGTLRGEEGTLVGVDLEDIYASGLDGAETVERQSSNTTSYDKLQLEFLIADGTAFLRNSRIENANVLVSLLGRSELAEQNLALRGAIERLPREDEKTPSVSFFVGGTMASPLFVPLTVQSQE